MLHYMQSLVNKTEEMEESRFMTQVRQKGVVPATIAHLALNYQRLRPADRLAGFTSLALIFRSAPLPAPLLSPFLSLSLLVWSRAHTRASLAPRGAQHRGLLDVP